VNPKEVEALEKAVSTGFFFLITLKPWVE